MAHGVVICLDSGTTAVKAAAFSRDGRVVSSAERPNSALRRSDDLVEQDMDGSRDDAFEVLAQCAAAAPGTPEMLIVTAQGDGLWPVDRALAPVGPAITWLDGRARPLVGKLRADGSLDAIEAATSAQPTAASQTLQLLWLQRNDPTRFDAITYALRLKEWLFLTLTGVVKAEPTSVIPTWGDWRRRVPVRGIEEAIGLRRGIDLLPPVEPIGRCRAPLSSDAARRLGLRNGIPVLIGPGDVQSTLIGLGLGLADGVSRGSVFGTSSIHARRVTDEAIITSKPPGAIIQPFALDDGYLCLSPCFNGAPTFEHVARLFGAVPSTSSTPAYSGLVIHPFFEPGGERAPVTSPDATATISGLSATTKPEEIAWAARESLSFIARHAHELMGGGSGELVVGGGLAGDAAFVEFLASTMQAPVRAVPGGQAGLHGLASIAARELGWSAEYFASPTSAGIVPERDAVMEYAEAKYRVFRHLLDAVAPNWPELTALRSRGATLP